MIFHVCLFRDVEGRYSNTCNLVIIGELQATVLSSSKSVKIRRIIIAQECHSFTTVKVI